MGDDHWRCSVKWCLQSLEHQPVSGMNAGLGFQDMQNTPAPNGLGSMCVAGFYQHYFGHLGAKI